MAIITKGQRVVNVEEPLLSQMKCCQVFFSAVRLWSEQSVTVTQICRWRGEDVPRQTVGVSGLVYLKEKGKEAYPVLSSPNCPRACLDSQTEDRRRGKKHTHTSKSVLDCTAGFSLDGVTTWETKKGNPAATRARLMKRQACRCCVQCWRWPLDGDKCM